MKTTHRHSDMEKKDIFETEVYDTEMAMMLSGREILARVRINLAHAIADKIMAKLGPKIDELLKNYDDTIS